MLSLQTLTTLESLLMSKSDPRWGEFMILGQVIQEVQQAKQVLMQARAQPALPPPKTVPGPSEPATPMGYKEVG